jgi:hypothetical protein
LHTGHLDERAAGPGGEAKAARAKSRDGVAIVANDRVAMWLLPFLESYRATNAATDLYLIPYDENVELTRRAADVYGAIWVDDKMEALDALARRLYPLAPYLRRRLRKLQALALPLDRVIYLDVDVILFRDFAPLFDKLAPGEADFIVASSSDKYVYNDKYAKHELFRDARLFNDGFFLTAPSILNLGDFMGVLDRDEKLFHAARKRGGLFAQPLVNFVVHRQNLRVRSLSECQPGASDESFYKCSTASFRQDGPADLNGDAIYFIHWAGATQAPRKRFFDAAWLDYAKAANIRMGL